MKAKESNFAFFYFHLLSFICMDIAPWLYLALPPASDGLATSGIGGPLLALRRGHASGRKASLDPLDLVGGNADREAESTILVTPAHDLGMFVEPMQPLPIAGFKGQLQVRAAASQAILDR
jgi:hypothetical protein